jgi:catechol 2,3-dioxygenase-like lactoylglutathione lyase family enzyme
MPEQLSAALDHTAVAVTDADAAMHRWRDRLGGRTVAWGTDATFRSHQLRYHGGGKIELLSPPEGGGGFVARFLERFGARPHHVTLKVPALGPAVATLRAAGLDCVDVREVDAHWHEAFLRPGQVGGLVVQIAWSGHSDDDWAASVGHRPEPPPADGPLLAALVLAHPDLSTAQQLWWRLGADVEAAPDGLVCAWPDSPIGIVIRQGEVPGPLALLFAGTEPLPAEEHVGPAIEVVGGLPA